MRWAGHVVLIGEDEFIKESGGKARWRETTRNI
jgi:hypothetical protein